ncbi:PIG-L deacetylase family protein [Truepera radiovictrix]|nr:PIG-L family deacetylase [Truepera radiovictrix]WMT58379.1 PIG-L family deacetylase [Truepera radiovictrix]
MSHAPSATAPPSAPPAETERAELMLVVPHPDDEVFGCGGLFSRMADAGKPVVTVTLTRGGAGRTLGLCTQAELAAVRERELRAALAVLGVPHAYVFDYPDFVPDGERGLAAHAGLREVPDEAVLPRLVTLFKRHRPRSVVTFPPNGANGHPDHVVTHAWVVRALACYSEATGEHPALYFFANERPYQGAVREGFLDAETIRRLHLPPTHLVEVGPYIENKLRAMAQHETQARSVLAFMRLYPRRLLVEAFHRARPSYPDEEGARTVTWLT